MKQLSAPVSGFLLLLSSVLVVLIIPTNAVKFTNFRTSFPDLVEDYDKLPASDKTIAEDEIRKMGHYDAPRTRLSRTGKYFIIEEAVNATETGSLVQRRMISGTAPTNYTARGVPVHHSLRGATKVIYINFIGGVVNGTQWNVGSGIASYTAKPFDTDGNTTFFSAAEKTAISYIWSRVAEDYIPWNVDVTTEPPAVFGPTTGTIMVTSSKDANGVLMPSSAAGGVAYVNVWGNSNYARLYSPTFIYANNLGPNREDYIADAASHEMGHNLGLSHDGLLSPAAAYYVGVGTGVTSWGPLMGAPYNRGVTKFNNGDYPNANNKEDDVAIITAKLGFRADDVGNTPATATALTTTSTGQVSGKGIIGQSTDIDVFSFVASAGLVSITALTYITPVHTTGNNLDIGMRLINSSGIVLLTNQLNTTSNAIINYTVRSAGTYYVAVYATGNPVRGYSVYGSAGQYSLSGSVVPVATTTTTTRATTTTTRATTSTATTKTATTTTTTKTATTTTTKTATTTTTKTTTSTTTTRTTTTINTTPAALQTTAQFKLTTFGVASAAPVATFNPGATLYASDLSGSTADIAGWVLSSDAWTWGPNSLKSVVASGTYSSSLSSSKPAISPTFSTLGYSSVSILFDRRLGVLAGDVANIQACVALPSGLFIASQCVTLWSNANNAVLDTDWKSVSYSLPSSACNAAAVQIRLGLGPTSPSAQKTSSNAFGWRVRSLVLSGR